MSAAVGEAPAVRPVAVRRRTGHAAAVAAAAALLSALTGCSDSGGGSDTSTSPPGATTGGAGGKAMITIKDFAFSPDSLTVAPGTVVTVANQDSTSHMDGHRHQARSTPAFVHLRAARRPSPPAKAGATRTCARSTRS